VSRALPMVVRTFNRDTAHGGPSRAVSASGGVSGAHLARPEHVRHADVHAHGDFGVLVLILLVRLAR
jgi:hypothetical protein